ncbi:MAG: radical SAM protein [Phycisphaerae bacterium]
MTAQGTVSPTRVGADDAHRAGRKVRFIEPQSRPGRPFNAWIRRWPLLGPIVLATILRNRGHDAAVYNENISGPLEANPRQYADVLSADVVGISIMTPTASRGYALADAVRRAAPRATIVFGGSHATFLPEEALVHGDIVCRGEGETVIEDIASGALKRGIVQGPPLDDLDGIPTLDHRVMHDFDALLASSRRREYYELPVMTSRGCPHGCTYCSVTRMFGGRIRRQSVEKVYADLRRFTEAGFRRFFFYDDNFTADRDWTRRLMERIEPMRVQFNAQARADFAWMDRSRRQADLPLLRLMRRAGGDVLYVGYETVDDATAAGWRKGYSGAQPLRERLMQDSQILHDGGFWIHGMFVLGPEHTAQTASQIIEFSRKARIESIQISLLTPAPGTPVFEEMRPHLAFTDFPGDWDYYDGTHCVYDNGRMGIDEAQRVLLDAHRRFYRWGGLSLRRIRYLVRQRVALQDRLGLLWANARTARRILRAWRQDTRMFLQTVAARRIRSAAAHGLGKAGVP